MKRHSSHWHGCAVLEQIQGVVRKDINLQEGFCRRAGVEKPTATRNARVSVPSCVLTAWWDRATTETTGGGATSMLLIWLMFAFMRGTYLCDGLLFCLQLAPTSHLAQRMPFQLFCCHPSVPSPPYRSLRSSRAVKPGLGCFPFPSVAEQGRSISKVNVSVGDVKGKEKGEERVLDPRSRGKRRDSGAGSASMGRAAPETPVPCLRLWKFFTTWFSVGIVLPHVTEIAGRKITRSTK